VERGRQGAQYKWKSTCSEGETGCGEYREEQMWRGKSKCREYGEKNIKRGGAVCRE
jgi:hypothetical protein